jgi:heme-degrading monooxygenase HmoA
VSVILEVAILHVRSHASPEFEAAFSEAQHIIESMPGYLGHELQRCIEVKTDPFPRVEHFELVHGDLKTRS